MNPSDLYVTTLNALYQSKSTLLSEAWHSALEGATKKQRIDSSVKLVELSNAITTLSNTQLSTIVTQMCEQEKDLNGAIDGVNAAIQKLEKVQAVLDAMTEIVGVVAKIVPLL